ncbi:Homeodomain-like protein, partial [Crassisporium funariophilum]
IMYQKISRDVKVAAIQLYERGLLALDDILDCCGLLRRTFYRILKLWRHTGNVIAPGTNRRGRPRMLDHDDLQHLLELVRENPDYFLDELLRLLETNHFISLHYATIHRELKHARISLKKLKIIALERDK